MYSLPKPVDLYRSAVPVAVTGIAWAVLSAFFVPWVPVLQLGLAVLAGAGFLWVRRHLQAEEAILAELTKLRFFKLRELPREPGKFYLGTGFFWQTRHTQAYVDLCGEDGDSRPVNEKAKGDLAIFGVGGLEAKPFWRPESDNNQHVCVLGSTGFGKTFLAQLYVDQAIASEAGCIIVDPKPDKDLMARAKRAAARLGKTVKVFDLANPERSATYNPISRGKDPAQLGARYSAACGEAKGDNKFFAERAAATGQIVANAMRLARAYLEALGGKAGQPPPVYVTLRAHSELLEKTLKEPTREAIESHRAGVKLPVELTPHGWTPRLTAAVTYGVNRPHVLLAWLAQIVHFAVIDGPLDAANFKTRDDAKNIWELHRDEMPKHPLLTDAGWASETLRREVPDIEKAKAALNALTAAMTDIFEMATHDEVGWQRINTSLPAALTRFQGPRQAIVEAVDPDIDWERVFEGKEIVYFALGAMVDRVGAEGFARLIIEDLVAYVGERQVAGKVNCPTYFLCDEIYSFVTPSYIDLLNKGRQVGLRCIAIGQSQADFKVKLGDHATEQIMTNFNTIVQLRSPEADAKAFAARAGGTRILQTSRTVSSSAAMATDQAGGTSQLAGFGASDAAQYSAAQQVLVPEDAVRRLPVGQAFIAGMGFVGIFAFPVIED